MADNDGKKQKPRNSKGGGPNKPDDNFDWSKIIRMVFGWGAVIVAAVILMQVFRAGNENYVEIPFAEYERLLNETGKITSAQITKSDLNDYFFRADLTSETIITIDNNSTTVQAISVYIHEPMIKDRKSVV